MLDTQHQTALYATVLDPGWDMIGDQLINEQIAGARWAVVELDKITTFGDPWMSLLRYWPAGTGWSLPAQDYLIPEREVSTAYSPAQMLASIRAHLSLTLKETASALRVERPTVYAWLAQRSEPHERNRRRVARLFELAVLWGSISRDPLGTRLRDTDAQGLSLLDLLYSERWDEARDRLMASPRAEQPVGARPVSIRETLARHGLETRVTRQRDEIDRVTAKRIGPE